MDKRKIGFTFGKGGTELRDLRGNIIEDGDLCIRTSFADKKSVLVYCVVFENRAFYVKPNWRTSKQDLINDIILHGKSITSFKFEDYQIIKLNILSKQERVIRQRLLEKLANHKEKGNFSSKYIKMAQDLIK